MQVLTERERDTLMCQHRLHQMTKDQTFVNMAKKTKKAFMERGSVFVERDNAFQERDKTLAYRVQHKKVVLF